ncbi:MAG: class 1 fructose-bisphosphatase [Sulfurospirillaceae bacterium]|nr:class 1 fructose-bisphosphatase [Sulfurospirillaceae bacterium]
MQEIYEAIKRSAIRIRELIEFDDTGYSTSTNSTGDTQLKIDIKSDLVIEDEFQKISCIKEIISEEKEDKTLLHSDGIYTVGYDPLDGSSLIDVNLSVGSIFGIYENGYNGADLKAAVYVVYGPRVELVIADSDVKMYRLNKNNEFVYMHDIKLKEKGKLNASGGTQKGWPKHHKKLIDDIFQDGYRLRYSGGMVPDLHQILLKGGGLFSYPGTTDTPKGKLRMIFEVFPFAFVFEKAGGRAIDENGKRILDLVPSHPHDTTPCFFGSKDEISKVIKYYE